MEERTRRFKTRARTEIASLSNKLQLMKAACPSIFTPPPCMQKHAVRSETSQRGAGRRLQRVQMRAPTSCLSKQRKVSEFNGAMEEGSTRRIKMRARTSEASLLKMLQPVKSADPEMEAPPPCMQKYAISRETFQRGAGRRVQRVQMRALTASCVSKQRKVSEFNGALEEGSRGFKSEHQRSTECQNSAKYQSSTGRWNVT